MLFQALSAKLGIVTGRNLAELCRLHFPRPVVLGMWGISEVAAMATDLAEFLGGAIGLSLLFHLPLLAGMVVTALATYGILMLDRRGYRPLELAITAMVGVIGASYLAELVIAPPDWGQAALHSVLPQLADTGALTLSVGIVGATVMPHAIYLHSGLTQARGRVTDVPGRRKLIRFSHIEVLVALTLAAFHAGHADVAEIETAYRTLLPLFGAGAAGVFLVSLIASGLSSSVVGTMAGQVIMQGFLRRRIPVWLRRAVTMVPAFVVVAMGANATASLVISQVVLSLALPVPMVALVMLTSRRSVMGTFANSRATAIGAVAATCAVLALNLLLLLQMVDVPLPFLPAS